MRARDSLEGAVNQKQIASDQPIQERLDQDSLNKTEAAKVFGQAFIGKSGPAMLDQWVSELRLNQEGVGIMRRNFCCNKKEEGVLIDDNKRTLVSERKPAKSATQAPKPRNVALS